LKVESKLTRDWAAQHSMFTYKLTDLTRARTIWK